MRKTLTFVLFLFININYSQNILDEKRLVDQLNQIQKAFLQQDSNFLKENFCLKKIDPRISRDSIIYIFKNIFEDAKSKDVEILNLSLEKASKIYKMESELQVMVKMTTELKNNSVRVVTESTLIFFSTDNGRNWCFSFGEENTNQMLNLNTEIVIPERKQNVYKI